MSHLVSIITADDARTRDQSLDAFCRSADVPTLLDECAALDRFRRERGNLYERVRALFFLYAIHRYHLAAREGVRNRGLVPFDGYQHLLQRRFEEAIERFQAEQRGAGPSDAISSALAGAYQSLGFQTLADQVRRSVRSVKGNQWMFRMGHPADHPLRVRPELARRPFPILRERTPVRMDLSHSGWSDIFFLGMDYPEGARVLNVSIDLGVRGRDARPQPPVETYLRVIDEPVLKLTSVDLETAATITSLAEVFDFARDYLGLLKAAVIASGIVPPGIESSGASLRDLLERVVGPGLGLEIVSQVNGIPKGSRLAVSTTLLASLVAISMRATGQTASLDGTLGESERRVVAARAILGEWLAGSGGGWQDSGGIWPGMKLIQGVRAAEGDPEFGISRGRLLPSHRILDEHDAPAEARKRLQESLVLVHGGMAQNVGPILEMVTEKYLLRSEAEWLARQQAIAILDEILALVRRGDVPGIGDATTRNFSGPIQTIIPWTTNLYTETVIRTVREEFGKAFWGFWMLGGMSGGGMGFIFAPEARARAQDRLHAIMSRTKGEMESALPFAMNPVVYDFAINERGSEAALLAGTNAPEAGYDLMPPGYYALMVPQLIREDVRTLPSERRHELAAFADACRHVPELHGMVRTLFDRLLPQASAPEAGPAAAAVRSAGARLDTLLAANGFDPAQHELIRANLQSGRIGLAQNRLPPNTELLDVVRGDVVDATEASLAEYCEAGMDALAAGQVAVVSLAAGVGSRWTAGAGVVKALNPFCRLGGGHRSFLEVHLAKSRRTSRTCGTPLPHLVTTSYLTHAGIENHLERHGYYGYTADAVLPGRPAGRRSLVGLSPGRSIGLRLVPTVRDLRFMWEDMPQQVLDEQAQKVRDSLHHALIGWATAAGEGHDYTDNLPMQCLHPVGHWYEVPNLLRNGVLAGWLAERPQLKYLMLHNVDTLGADVDPGLLGLHIALGSCLTFEVITRWAEDRGGGLARVDGRVRLVEGLAMPNEEAEFGLTYYNSNTTWIDIDLLLEAFGLTREDLQAEGGGRKAGGAERAGLQAPGGRRQAGGTEAAHPGTQDGRRHAGTEADDDRVAAAVRALAARMPTYVTLKDVKKRWGHGQEDVFPVAQFEKLWPDMTALPEVACRFVAVPRRRGQQLKDPAQLDGWLRDGSAAYVESLCEWA